MSPVASGSQTDRVREEPGRAWIKTAGNEILPACITVFLFALRSHRRCCCAVISLLWAEPVFGTLSFQEVATAKGLVSTGSTYGGAWVPDVNGDSRPDLWSGNHGSADDPVLYLSTPAGGFSMAPASFFQGLGSRDFHGSGWADIDNDGDKDLIVVAGAGQGAHSEANMLLVNNGNGVLVESAVAYQVDYPFARSRDVLWFDWNNDGYLDLLLVNRNDRTQPPDAKTQIFTFDAQNSRYVEESFALDQHIEQLWAQLSFNNPSLGGSVPAFFTLTRKGNALVDKAFSFGSGGLTDVEADLAMPVLGFSNDSAMGDFDNDGAQDAVFVNNGAVKLYLQSATGFAEPAGATGLTTNLAAFVVAEDFNNDMWLDLYVSRSNPGPDVNLPNMLYLNQGDGTFQALAQAGGAEGTSAGYVSATASVDYNNDGRMDIYTANSDNWWAPRALTLSAPMELFENQDSSGNHWLKIELRGTQSNADGIGASVWVTAGGITQLREMNGGLHARTQNDSRLHFGLAGETTATTVVVNWPSGETQTLSNVAADQILQITEPGGTGNVPPVAQFVATASSTPLTINFDAQTSFDPDGNVVSWMWDFGDTQTGQGETVSHTYPAAGDYTVSLTVADDEGAMHTTSQVVTVSTGGGLIKLVVEPKWVGANAFKKARLTDELGGGAQNLATYWNSGSSDDSSWATFDLGASQPVREVLLAPRLNVHTQYEIHVGNVLAGNQVTGVQPSQCTVLLSGSGSQPGELATCATGTASGRYVTVVVPDARFQRIYGTEIYAQGGPVNQSPVASFTRTPMSGEAPLAVQVDGTASFDPDGTITDYAWDFGNGDSASGSTANTSYSDPGEYTISLTVTDNGGAIDQTTHSVSVQGPPVPPQITGQPDSVSVTEGQDASFSVVATGTAPLTYEWFRDAVSISGETDADLLLSNVQLDDDGAVFTVSVTNVAGSVTSAPATLTVSEASGEPIKQAVVIEAVGANTFKGPRAIDELGSGEQNLTTNWGSGSGLDNAWITLDLGATLTVAEVHLGMGPNRAYDVEVHVGDVLTGGKVTGASPQTCSTPQGSGFNPTVLTECPLTPVTGRYVMLQVPGQKFVRFHGTEIYVQP